MIIHQTISCAVQKTLGRSKHGTKKERAPLEPKVGFPIPLGLPCDIFLGIVQMLPPESVVSVICCCKDMHSLYCKDDLYCADNLWEGLLSRTFPMRLTGAPGPNAPPRLHRSLRITCSGLSCEWVEYLRELRKMPRVTGVQIAKFVRWAASAHSWYKHIPLQDAAVFSFVLDLTVGMKRTHDGFVEQLDVRATPRRRRSSSSLAPSRPLSEEHSFRSLDDP